MQRVKKRKKRGVVEKLNGKKRNALAKNPARQPITNTVIGRAIETGRDHDPQPTEGRLMLKTVAAGHLPMIARSAVIG